LLLTTLVDSVAQQLDVSLIPSAVANFANACNYLCYKNCLVSKLDTGTRP